MNQQQQQQQQQLYKSMGERDSFSSFFSFFLLFLRRVGTPNNSCVFVCMSSALMFFFEPTKNTNEKTIYTRTKT